MKRLVGWLGGVLLLGVFVALGSGYHPAPAVPSSPVIVSPSSVAVSPPLSAPSPPPVPVVVPTPSTPPAAPSSEAAFKPDSAVVLTVPRFGADYRKEIVEGTEPAQLGDTNGPVSHQNIGHYIGSADLGQPGNYAIIGHRNPGVMGDLDKLVTGDEVRISSPTGVYVYKVTAPALTLLYATTEQKARADEILDPVPGSAASVGAAPTGSYMTITSCGLYGESPRRLAVVLKLSSVQPPE